MKNNVLIAVFLFAISIVNSIAQAPVLDYFRVLDDEQKEALESLIESAKEQTGLEFHGVTNSQANPQIEDNVATYINSGVENQVFLLVNVQTSPDPRATIYLSPDLSAVYSAEFIESVQNQMNEQISDGFADGGETQAAITTGIMAFIQAAGRIVFEPWPDATPQWGFDAFDNPVMADEYTTRTDMGEQPYGVAWKSLPTLGVDQVVARRTDNGVLPDGLRYEDDAGLSVPPIVLDASHTKLNLSGSAGSGNSKAIFARRTEINADGNETDRLLGQLNTVSYDRKTLNVVVIPVNGATVPTTGSELQESLLAIYRSAIVETVNVTVLSNLDVPDFDGTMDDEESGFLADYLPEMHTIIDAFEDVFDTDSHTAYIFVVPDAQRPEILGYMPRARRYGFLYANNIRNNSSDANAAFSRTLAHEIGHGTYHLKHVFEEYPSLPQSAPNLMGYSESTRLHKWQWDQVDDPVFVWPWSGGDDGGESVMACGSQYNNNEDILDFGNLYTASEESQLASIINRIKNRHGWRVILYTYDPFDFMTPPLISSDCSIQENFLETIVFWIPQREKQDTVNITISNDLNQIITDSIVQVLCSEFNDIISPIFTVFGTTRTALEILLEQNKLLCTVCSKDLTLTVNRLDSIFDHKADITFEEVDLFNFALQKGGLNTCRSHAHFFAQVKVETDYFRQFVENSNYRLEGWYNIFGTTRNKPYTGVFFKQTFWDNEEYLNYFHFRVYRDTKVKNMSKRRGQNYTKYRWRHSTATAADTIVIPTRYSVSTRVDTGTFIRVNFSPAEIDIRNRNLWSYTYGGLLGNREPSTEDGYNYRGRGGTHLTGRTNYINASNKANELFDTNYDWAIDYELCTTETKSIVYSSVAYFHLVLNTTAKWNKLLDSDDVTFISHKINGGNNGLASRISFYNSLRTNIYSCQ